MITPDNLVVQGFWQGPLTTMERLSMRSFIAHGHEYRLFSYEELEGVPDGVVVCDAAEIVPESEMATFRCAQQLSDFFRIALLLKNGGWYSDLDNVLIKRLDMESEYCFYRDYDESTISFALSKAPPGSPIMQHCHEYLAGMSAEERSCLPWQAIGSEFACGAVEYFKMTEFAQAGRCFDPVQWENARKIVDPSVEWDLSQSYSVHLFHAVWNKGPEDKTGRGFDLGHRLDLKLDTDGEYPDECLYEILKRKYL